MKMSKTRSEKRKKKAAGRKQLGIAIVEGKGHNAIQQAARKAGVEPKSARKFQKEMK